MIKEILFWVYCKKNAFRVSSKKGFFITLDALISIALILITTIIAYYYLSQVDSFSWDRIDLMNIVNDEAIILEKSGLLSNAIIQGSTEELSLHLDKTPYSYCFEISIYPKNSNIPILFLLKKGCSKNIDEYFSINRSLVVYSPDVNFYIVKFTGWKK